MAGQEHGCKGTTDEGSLQQYRGENVPGGCWSQEFKGEKRPGGWPAVVEKADAATQSRLAETDGTTESPENVGDKVGEESPVTAERRKGSGDEGRDKDVGTETTAQERLQAEVEEAAASCTTAEVEQSKVTFGGYGSEPGEFHLPHGVVVSPSNEIFVADTDNRRIQVHSMKGGYLRHFLTVVPGTEDEYMSPHDVCVDSNGTLWVVGSGCSPWDDDHVVQYSTVGTAMAGFHLSRYNLYRGIAVDMRNTSNLILVTAEDHNKVEVFRPDGSLVRRFGNPFSAMTRMRIRPEHITVDGEGNIIVSYWNTGYVYVFGESGRFVFRFRGPESGEDPRAWPEGARGICTDSSGHILVAHPLNQRVQIFTRHGEYLRSIRTGSAPDGLAVGPEGQLVVTNAYDHAVTVFSSY
ncbi:PREDICTED: E3 ubiquitin-protein ligase TRIM71-like [Branchiostoma belcheri]|uniref:E3 ubiquitin-protein ligase TRIM71-like n=1 Tax=Branchiostoma belcheri TaxID=7741 RepID=A0A6P5A929_BRABE|nr:PREDICTED: E3 ubiquitin-protein ligase TRIM71-like [Branchiostoma belcheri]